MIAYIPARYESSRFPGKVLVEIGQKPLINIVVENAAKCDYISEVVVLTDDDRIEEAVKKVNYTKVRVVNGTLGHNGSDRVFRYIDNHGVEKEPFVIIQADCPDLDPMIMNHILAGVITDKDYSIHTIAYSFLSDDKYDDPDDPNIVKVVFNSRNGEAFYFSRSPIPFGGSKFYKHVGVYVFPHGMVTHGGFTAYWTYTENLEQLQWLMDGIKIKVHTVLNRLRTIDVPRDYAQFSALTMK